MTIKNKTIRQLSILGITGAILAGAASQYFWVQPKVEAVALQDTPAPVATTKDWALFGGSVSRNLVNLVEKISQTLGAMMKARRKMLNGLST